MDSSERSGCRYQEEACNFRRFWLRLTRRLPVWNKLGHCSPGIPRLSRRHEEPSQPLPQRLRYNARRNATCRRKAARELPKQCAAVGSYRKRLQPSSLDDSSRSSGRRAGNLSSPIPAIRGSLSRETAPRTPLMRSEIPPAQP